jgi:uncharacterized protein (DUF486 family)
MNWHKTLVIFALCLLTLLSCGINEYYYLPQVPENRIERTINTEARINIPSNLLNQVDHYATGYVIFYKIYISNAPTYDTITQILSNNSRIYSDYNALFPYTDPSNTTSITSLNTFSGRGFYELELEGTNIRNTVLSKSGGIFSIQFPPISGDIPYLEYNGNRYFLYRSNGEGKFTPKPDRYFLSSSDLNDYANAIPTINADVSGQSGVSEFAYASMYIAAVGQDPRNFSRLYGKPTHISIFLMASLLN